MKWLAPAMASSGVIACMCENYDKAEKSFRRAEKWLPGVLNVAEYAGFIGLALFENGELEEARPHLEKGIQEIGKVRRIAAPSEHLELEAAMVRRWEDALKMIDT